MDGITTFFPSDGFCWPWHVYARGHFFIQSVMRGMMKNGMIRMFSLGFVRDESMGVSIFFL